jgi:hypothetical protein
MNTSQYLLEFLQSCDEDDESEKPTSAEEKKLTNLLDTLRIASVESVLPEQLSEVVKHLHSPKDILEYALDDHYSRYFLREVPKVVKRALKLEPVFIKRPIAERVEIYVREATRAYLFGLFQASIALARSALEESLKGHLRADAPVLAQSDELVALLRVAERSKLLNSSLIQSAHDVRKTANAVLHGTRCGDLDAFGVLIKTRKVLDALHSGRKR